MTETQNVATYARIRPYNPAIKEDKRLTARAVDDERIMLKHSGREYTYNFTKVFDMKNTTNEVFEDAMKPLLDFKILQGINSIFMVYGQSGSGKSFTLIGEPGQYGVLSMSLRYLLNKDDIVDKIDIASIEAYGVNAAKIGFYDLVHQLSSRNEMKQQTKNAKKKKKNKNQSFDPFACKHNPVLSIKNAKFIQVTKDNCFNIIRQLQEVSHMAPTLKNPHSSRGHTVYFCRITMKQMEDVFFIAADLAGSEGKTALGNQDEFVSGLKLAMKKGKLKLSAKNDIFHKMYKIRALEAGCINNGLTNLQTMFGELIKQKISKSRGLGLRKILSPFISLKSSYVIMFTMSASLNNTKVTKATLNFAKQTQLVKVNTQKAKKKIDKDKVIKELNILIEKLKIEITQKDKTIANLTQQLQIKNGMHSIESNSKVAEILTEMNSLTKQISDAVKEEAKWNISINDIQTNNVNENELKTIFNEFDADSSGYIDAYELHNALQKMGKDINMDQVNEMVQDVDVDGNGEIDFDEFKVMVSKQWFIDTFQSKLVNEVETFMTNTMHCEYKLDMDDSKDLELEMDRNNTQILIDNIKFEYEQKLNALKAENEQLKADMMGLQNKPAMDDDMTIKFTDSKTNKRRKRKLTHELEISKIEKLLALNESKKDKSKSNLSKRKIKRKKSKKKKGFEILWPAGTETNMAKVKFIYSKLSDIKSPSDERMAFIRKLSEIISHKENMNESTIKYAINGFQKIYSIQMKGKNSTLVQTELYNILFVIISNYSKYFELSMSYFLKHLMSNISEHKFTDLIENIIQHMIEQCAGNNENQLIVLLNEFILNGTKSKYKNTKLKGWNFIYIALKTRLTNNNNQISKDVIISVQKPLKIGLCSNDKHIQSKAFLILNLLFNSNDIQNKSHKVYVGKLYQRMSVSAQKLYKKKYANDIVTDSVSDIKKNKRKNIKKRNVATDNKNNNNMKHRKYKPIKKKNKNNKSKSKNKKEKSKEKKDIVKSDEYKESEMEYKNDDIKPNDNKSKHRKYKPKLKRKRKKNKKDINDCGVSNYTSVKMIDLVSNLIINEVKELEECKEIILLSFKTHEIDQQQFMEMIKNNAFISNIQNDISLNDTDLNKYLVKLEQEIISNLSTNKLK